jgi:hypothetical protein
MIKTMNQVLPKEINNDIIKLLLKQRNWGFAFDNGGIDKFIKDVIIENTSNRGFNIITYDDVLNIKLNSALNIYADIVFCRVKEFLKINFKRPSRYFWNYYDSSSTAFEHIDSEDKNKISIIYNLHDNDGGTMINNRFYESKGGQAIIFSSNIIHKGIMSENKKHRFNLNIIGVV